MSKTNKGKVNEFNRNCSKGAEYVRHDSDVAPICGVNSMSGSDGEFDGIQAPAKDDLSPKHKEIDLALEKKFGFSIHEDSADDTPIPDDLKKILDTPIGKARVRAHI